MRIWFNKAKPDSCPLIIAALGNARARTMAFLHGGAEDVRNDGEKTINKAIRVRQAPIKLQIENH